MVSNVRLHENVLSGNMYKGNHRTGKSDLIYPHSLHVYLMRSLAWLTNDVTSVYSNKCTARIIVHSISNYSVKTRQKVHLSAPWAPGMGSNTEALVNYRSQLNHHCCTI